MTLTAMPKYDAYKDTGIEWIGDIPHHWQTIRLRNLFSFSKGLNITKDDLQDDGIPCVNYGEVHSKFGFELNPSKHKLKCVCESYLKNGKSLLFKGDFVFADTSEDISGSGNFTQLISDDVTFAGYHTVIARPIFNQNSRFLAYLFDSISYRNQIRSNVKGVKVFSITKSILKDTWVWLPDESEKIAIVNFLDKNTTKIDEAIAIKEQQIELLNERKQILIQQAVIKGLNQNAPMKKSGVDWIGDIPEHWSLQPGFIVFNENKKSNNGMIESQVLSLSYGKIIVKAKEKLNGLVPESFETYQVVSPGNIIIRCTDLQNDKTSLRTGLVKNHGIITSAYLCLNISPEQHAEYIHYFLHALDVCKEIYRYGSGLRQSLSFSDFKRMLVITPPIEEQDQIVTFIKEQEKNIVSAVELLKTQIEKLTEYKQSLIHSAVTGNIKVI